MITRILLKCQIVILLSTAPVQIYQDVSSIFLFYFELISNQVEMKGFSSSR